MMACFTPRSWPCRLEVYGLAIHDTHLVTGGYGRDSGVLNDWVSLRFNLTTGERDPDWGDAPKGAVPIDPSGLMLADNCRNAVALPGDKTVLVGSTGPGNMPVQDAAFAVLDADGDLDTAYGDGVHIFAFGASAVGDTSGATISFGVVRCPARM